MDPTPAVDLIQITKHFGDLVAVDHVSLQVNSSEFVTLLGPSGCGKTTLLRIIGGFISPDHGKVVLNGADVTASPPYRRDVCTVFQQYALFPHMTVADNVAFGLERRRIARDEIKSRVEQALDMVQMSGLEQRRPSELSGGQQQRVAVARALVLQPKVLLLDEPLAALDLKLRKQMQLELKGLQRRLGISFIYVTHDQEEALTMSDRIAVMNRGHIEQVGSAAEVYDRPKTEFVADFIGLSNILEGSVVTANGETLVLDVGGYKVEAASPNSGQNINLSAQIGTTCRFMVRPEKIVISPAESPGGIPASIETVVYLGESTRWGMKLSCGPQVQAIRQNSGSSAAVQLEIGQQVSISWAPGTAVLL
ncbi:MAG TPA: ABC transporter ATP-binding protein [Blastocatellia bacterium]